MSRLQEIVKLEKKNNRRLKKLLLLLALQYDNPLQFATNINANSIKIQKEIKKIKQDAEKLANKHSEEENQIKLKRSLIIAIASVNILKMIYNSITTSEQTYQMAVKTAITNNLWSIHRFSTTETFNSYNKKYIANWSKVPGHYRWNATLDNRTCNICESYDGKTYDNAGDVPDQPHISCRCTIDFIRK